MCSPRESKGALSKIAGQINSCKTPDKHLPSLESENYVHVGLQEITRFSASLVFSLCYFPVKAGRLLFNWLFFLVLPQYCFKGLWRKFCQKGMGTTEPPQKWTWLKISLQKHFNIDEAAIEILQMTCCFVLYCQGIFTLAVYDLKSDLFSCGTKPSLDNTVKFLLLPSVWTKHVIFCCCFFCQSWIIKKSCTIFTFFLSMKFIIWKVEI